MEIEVSNRQKTLSLDTEKVRLVVETLLEKEGVRSDEISILFVEEEEIAQLHDRFFGDPSPTDCITLPIDPEDDGGYRHLGEVIISPRAALRYVEEQGGDPHEETLLYLVHGLLHLLGYEDIEEEAIERMRHKEKEWLAYLQHKNLEVKPATQPTSTQALEKKSLRKS